MSFISSLNHLVWDNFLVYFLILCALFFTLSLKFVQVRHFGRAIKIMLSDNSGGHVMGITSFQALCTSLASRIGTGNIVGVALAIYLGGPGAVFWMWILAFCGMATSFVEGALAQLYKIEDPVSHLYRGGPAYYIKYGLGSNLWAKIFALSLIFTYLISFNAFQAYSISDAFEGSFGVRHWTVAVGLTLFEGVMIFGGVKRIAKITGIVVPTMAIIYLCLAIFVVGSNWHEIPHVINLIITSALGLRPAGAALLGYTMQLAMAHGIRRGLFSNEAGMGSAPNIAAAARTGHPVTQGYLQMLGPFFDTIVVCTCTAMIVLFSNKLVPGSGLTGVKLVQESMMVHVGTIGHVLITICLTCFATMTMLGNYTYAEMNLCFILPNVKNGLLLLLRIVGLFVIATAPFGTIDFVMNLSDFTMGIMTAINLVAILLLSPEVLLMLKDYSSSALKGGEPRFSLLNHKKLLDKIKTGVWTQ